VRLIATKQRVAHAVEKPTLLPLRLPGVVELYLQFLDPRIGALKCFILHQDRLNERVSGIGSLLHAVGN
jgi:hypothetical protein